jgi:hypothetical protein
MATHAPVELQADRADLAALADGILSFGVDGNASGHPVSAAWLCTATRSFLVTTGSHDIAFRFEVFALAISAPQSPGPPPKHLAPWPLQKWRVDVLRRLDWIVDPERMPPALRGTDFWSGLGPGEVPPGTEHACMVAAGLLFTGTAGGRVLIAADDFPLSLLVTQDPGVIDRYLKPCFLTPLEDYAPAL